MFTAAETPEELRQQIWSEINLVNPEAWRARSLTLKGVIELDAVPGSGWASIDVNHIGHPYFGDSSQFTIGEGWAAMNACKNRMLALSQGIDPEACYTGDLIVCSLVNTRETPITPEIVSQFSCLIAENKFTA